MVEDSDSVVGFLARPVVCGLRFGILSMVGDVCVLAE